MRSIEIQTPDNDPHEVIVWGFPMPGAHRLGNGCRVPGQLCSIAESPRQASPFDGIFVSIRSPVPLDLVHFRDDMRERSGSHGSRRYAVRWVLKLSLGGLSALPQELKPLARGSRLPDFQRERTSAGFPPACIRVLSKNRPRRKVG